jgi:hypothetical protein
VVHALIVMPEKPMDETDRDNDEWTQWWDARVSAMESLLGISEDIVGHSTVPFDFGADLGGAADIIYFRNHVDGVGYATSELIGRDDQVANALGNYELLIFHREDCDWGADLISRLAFYTCQAELNPGNTMDIDSIVPEGSTIVALLFCDYGHFEVRGRDSGLLLCIGITSDELTECQSGNQAMVESALKKSGVFPFTDLYRVSTLNTKEA